MPLQNTVLVLCPVSFITARACIIMYTCVMHTDHMTDHVTDHVNFLYQTILKDITETGIDRSSPKHKMQRNFIGSIMKGLSSSNKQLCEAATICAVDLFKAGSFVADRSGSFFRYFVSQVQGQLHVRT